MIEANGSYVVNGLEVMFLQKDEGEREEKKQVFVINEGKDHVDGYEIELPCILKKPSSVLSLNIRWRRMNSGGLPRSRICT
jgi:hypothetical protein